MSQLTPTAQTGALTLLSLVKNYKPQMISLLLRNGVIVRDGMSDEQIAKMMADVLKVSAAYKKDIAKFLSTPQVAQKVAQGFMNFTEDAKFFNVSGFTDATVPFCDRPENANLAMCKKDPLTPVTGSTSNATATTTGSTTQATGGFWTNLLNQVPSYLNQGLGLLGSMDKNKTDRIIAESAAAQAQAQALAAQGYAIDPATGKQVPLKKGMSTGVIVALVLVGVVGLGTLLYFGLRSSGSSAKALPSGGGSTVKALPSHG